MRSEFAKRVRNEARVSELHRAFLGRAYSLKEIADYDTGSESRITHEQAATTIEEARQFVTVVAALVLEEE